MMVYLMPVMMLLWFNSYSSGLTYYYFLANILTIGQTLVIRRMIDDEKIHAVMQANAAKNKNRKKSKFQLRYEELLRQQEEAQRNAYPTEITERCEEFPNKFSKLKITLSESILTGVITYSDC